MAVHKKALSESPINYRLHRLGDESSIFDLANAVWGLTYDIPEKSKWHEGWQWMFTHNPSGPPIVWLAEHSGKIVSEYPLILMDICVDHKYGKAAQIVDTMTHPEYRRQGIAINLAGFSLNQLKEQKALLAFGFPSQMAYPLHIKSGWIDVCAIRLMFLPLNLNKILKTYSINNKTIISLISK